jgi:uncharacterized protein YkwD
VSRPVLINACAGALPARAVLGVVVAAVSAAATVCAPPARADDRRIDEGVVADVYTVQHQHGCATDVKINPQLRLAAQWHAQDVVNDYGLDADVGSDGSTVQDRAANAGFKGVVAETVAVNPALAINGVEIMNQWVSRPDYMATMSNCANTQIGVWSETRLDRSVVVAVYGQPA